MRLGLGLCLLAVNAAPSAAQSVWAPIGPNNASVFALVPSPHTDGEILIGTFFGGLYRTSDRGIQWTHVTSPFSSFTVFAIAYDPNQPGVIFVATFGNGLFKSVDDGASWTTQDNGLPDSTISDVAVDPDNPGAVLVASESGVFRSTDGGESWSETTSGLGISARTLVFDPSTAGQVYLGTRQEGTYRSVDGGQTWQVFNEGLGLRDVNWLGFSPSGSDLYAATNSGVFQLGSGANTWSDLTLDLPETPVNRVLEHPVDGRLFAATNSGVFVMETTASTWSEWTPRPSRLVHIDAVGSPIYVAALASEFVATVDDGESFFAVSNGIQNLFAGSLAAVAIGGESVVFAGSDNGVHITSSFFKTDGVLPWFADDGFDQVVFVLTPHPTEPGTLFAGTERAGVWKSTDWGINWAPQSNGIVPTHIFALSQSSVGNNTLYAATNAGLYVSRDDGVTWAGVTGLPASVRILDVLADPVFPGVAYVATDDAQLHKTIDDGLSFQSISTGLPGDTVLALAAAPFGNLYAVTNRGELHVSANAGDEWFPTGNEIAEPVLSVATDPDNPFIAYVGTNGGGVYRSITDGLTWEPVNVGIDIPFVFALTIDPKNVDVLYAGSVNIVYKSTDGADNWSAAGAGLPNGFVQEIVVDNENSNVLYAFVAGAGIYRTSDGGQQWAASVTGDPFLEDVPLAISHVTSNKLFAGSDVQGVYASTDAGQTFTPASEGMNLFVRGLAISTQQPDVLFAGSLGGGIFRSIVGGNNWTNQGLDDRNVFSVAINPQDDAIVYAATSLGVVKTVDGGESFLELGQKTSVIFTMVVNPSDRDVIYIGSSAGNVFVSTNAGLTWTRANQGLPPANILDLAIDPNDGTLYASAERQGVFKSSNGGASWQATETAIIGALQVVSLTVDASEGTIYAAAANAGIYRSANGGASWEAIITGFSGDVASQIVVDASSNTLFAAALNEPGNFSGVSRSTDGGTTWTNSSDGLATESVESITIDPINPGTLYAATPMGVYRSTDSGVSWQPANVGLETTQVTRVLVDPLNANVLYAATHGSGVFRSPNGGGFWVQGALDFVGVEASSLAVGRIPGTFYLGSLTNGFFRTIDGGDAWLGGIDPRLAEPIVTFLAIHPQRPEIVYAAASGVGLLKSTNAGITWDVVGEEIGNPFILAIAIDPVDPSTMYVGTTGAGVWISRDTGDTWSSLNDGLFNLNVTSLLVDPADHNVIYVGTEGGGIFMNDRTPPPIDRDGDGVFDQEDCAPDDPRLATIHTFYHDYDDDSFGVHREEPLIPPDFNIETAVDVCELVPGIGLVPWTNDPWDFDGFQFIQTQLKGDRLYGVDFNSTNEDGQFADEELIDLGPDATTLHVIWSDVETAPGVFDGPQAAALTLANQAFSQRNLKVSLTLSAIVSGVLTVPEDLRQGLATNTIPFTDPVVIQRFLDFMVFVRGQLPDLDIMSIQIGYEIDKLMLDITDPVFWLPYVNFHLAAREGVKLLWGDTIPISSIWTTDGFLNPNLAPLRDLMVIVDDVVSLTYFPHHDDFTIHEPIEILEQLQQINDVTFPNDVYFQAVGYPSAPITGSSTTKQSQFLYAFFEFWDQAMANVRFVSFGQLHDVSRTRAEVLADSPEFRQVGPANRDRLVGYLSSLGLRTFDGAGEHKSAYNTLRNHAFDRGWFRDVPRTSRSFYMGFTQAPFDFPPDAPTQIEVFAWMRDHFITDSDLSFVHLDGGVPWVEAFADDFTSGELPYSQGVRDSLRNDRDTIPAGNRVAVAINPLGVPRHLLASYWGVGEGFDFDEDFNRIPNGSFADADKRALPPPWDTYDFDSQEVRIAFLKYAMRIIDYFQPDYLMIGIEVSAALTQDRAAYEQYFEMHKWLYNALKAIPEFSHIPIMVSFSATSYMVDEFGIAYKFDEQEPGEREAQLDALSRMLPYTDIIGLSHYPHFGKYSAYTLSAMLYDELFEVFERFGAGDKPIAITEGGFTADPYDILDGFVYTGTPEKQDRHYRLLFRELSRHRNPVEFIVNFKIRDSDLGWQRLVDGIDDQTGQGTADFIEFLKFFRDIGLYDGEGNLRPAGVRWREELALPGIPNLPSNTELILNGVGGKLTARFNLDITKRLFYFLDRGSDLALSSSLGITVDGVDLAQNISQISVSDPVTVQVSYDTFGVHAFASTSYNAFTITAQRDGPGDSELRIEVRLYDDAFAYRYVIPGVGLRLVTGEDTNWVLPALKLWYQDDATVHEGIYRSDPIGTFQSSMGGPITAELPNDVYLVLTEANVGTYSGLSYSADGMGTPRIQARFSNDVEWTVEGGTTTPWRVVLLSDDLNALVNSDVITSLNEAPDPVLFPQGSATDWIRPGRALYSIWADPGSGFSFDIQKAYIDSAHALGFEYVVVGAGWEIGFPFFGFTDAFEALASLVQYAHSDGRNVDIIVWKPYAELQLPEARDFFFQVLETVGAAGILIDVSSGDSQAVNEFIESALPEAAAHRLVVSLANTGKPTGQSRTYPNLLTREAVRGLEWNKVEEDLTPTHNAILPFTRFLAGPGDYAPVTFDPAELGDTTFTHQLATAGIFTSPLQTWSVRPELLAAQPEILDVVRAMPSVWDETLVLPSRIGALVAFARRTGDRWFLFILNGSSEEAVTIEGLELAFLGDGVYDAVYLGSDTPTTWLRFEESGVERTAQISVPMLPGSGFVGMFTPLGPEATMLRRSKR